MLKFISSLLGLNRIKTIDIGEFNEAVNHLFYLSVNEGFKEMEADYWGHEKVIGFVIHAETAEDQESYRFLRADYAARMLSEFDPKYLALVDREREFDIDERENYIYSIIVNDFGYEPN